MVYGTYKMIIDISKYQNKIDWFKVKQSKDLQGVYIKATEGVGYVDPMFKSHVIGANTVGIQIGFYHFATLNSTNVIADSAAEAKAFFEATKGIGVGLPYVLDIEKNDGHLSKEDVLKWIQNFVLTLHTCGINDIVLYSYTLFLDANLPTDHQLGIILPLWLASYTPTYKLPHGWAKVWLWQYSQKGQIDGIMGNVDLSKEA